MTDSADSLRLAVSSQLSGVQKAEFGQFLTPKSIATFMAGLFEESRLGRMRLLDAGAGIGVLSEAVLERRQAKGHAEAVGTVTAYEIDSSLREHLAKTLKTYQRLADTLDVRILPSDFIEESARLLHTASPPTFTHAILNPPYRKIRSKSKHRSLLRSVNIETVNLYTAFVALVLLQMEKGGEVVAIIPRSFCNGVYYRPFREFLLTHSAIKHIHLFGSRTSAFSDDDVLQENIIIKIIAGQQQGRVTVSTSRDASFLDVQTRTYSFEDIVLSNDKELFIHIPTADLEEDVKESPIATHSLDDLGLQVSTGPVVDFRLREHLRQSPNNTTVPLLYAGHFVKGRLCWPRENVRKANAIVRNNDTEKWLYPNEWYTVVRRFSSKEERRRVVAYVVDPTTFDVSAVGFENHLNVFHHKRTGLEARIARGLHVYLNSTVVDRYFRRFSGHTQVNATDLRTLRYPSAKILMALGEWAEHAESLSQYAIDTHLNTYAS